ncbi:hypothetical protein U1Q18_048680, partial [Sarracenia purpurea var. burkii]
MEDLKVGLITESIKKMAVDWVKRSPPKGDPINAKDNQLRKGLHRETINQSHSILWTSSP